MLSTNGRLCWVVAGLSAWAWTLAACSSSGGSASGEGGAPSSSGSSSGGSASGGSGGGSGGSSGASSSGGGASGAADSGASSSGSAPTCATDVDTLRINGSVAGLTTPFDLTNSSGDYINIGSVDIPLSGGGDAMGIVATVPPSGSGMSVGVSLNPGTVPAPGQTFTVAASGTPLFFIVASNHGSNFPQCRLAAGSTFTFNGFADEDAGDNNVQIDQFNVSWSGNCEPDPDAGQAAASPVSGCFNFINE